MGQYMGTAGSAGYSEGQRGSRGGPYHLFPLFPVSPTLRPPCYSRHWPQTAHTYSHLLEPPLQRRIFLDELAVLVERGGSDAAQLP